MSVFFLSTGLILASASSLTKELFERLDLSERETRELASEVAAILGDGAKTDSFDCGPPDTAQPGGYDCNGGCINGNIGYPTMEEAWERCGQVAGCTRIMMNGLFYLRKANDRWNPNGLLGHVDYVCHGLRDCGLPATLQPGGYDCNGGCINGNIGYSTMENAWERCGKVAGCTRIVESSKNGLWYLRKANDNPNRLDAHVDYVCQGYDYTRKVGGCVKGKNMQRFSNKSIEECKKLCDDNRECKAFEYGVAHGGRKNFFKPRDCQLNSSADDSNCNGRVWNLDLFIKQNLTGKKGHFLQ